MPLTDAPRIGRMKLWPASAVALLPAAAACAALLAGGCGGTSDAAVGHGDPHKGRAAAAPPAPAALLVERPSGVGGAWRTTATVGGRPAAWIARRSGVTLMRFDQALLRLVLHPGSGEPRGRGWKHADRIGAGEVHRVVAGFNGGFKLGYGSVGFMAEGRVGVRLGRGLGSIVAYTDGKTEIGAWRRGVPAPGRTVASVLQNMRLLVARGKVAPTVESCIIVCWGKTFGGRFDAARTALGIDGEGRLVWAASEDITPAALGAALLGAGAVNAVELDINPGWVSGYLYVHRPNGPAAVPAVPGQHEIAGRLIRPDQRDFFTVVAG
jgi:hypothetical protein